MPSQTPRKPIFLLRPPPPQTKMLGDRLCKSLTHRPSTYGDSHLHSSPGCRRTQHPQGVLRKSPRNRHGGGSGRDFGGYGGERQTHGKHTQRALFLRLWRGCLLRENLSLQGTLSPFYRRKTATEGAVSLHIPPRTQKISPCVKKTAGEV